MRVDEKILHMLGTHVTGDFGPWTFYTSRRSGVVWYPRSPALQPPTPLQIHWRNKFRLAGFIWRGLQPEQRANWMAAEKLANLSITGYNLFTYFITTEDAAPIQTIERQTGLKLIPFDALIS